MSRFDKVLISSFGVAAFVVLGLYAFFAGPLYTNTEYAPGFSEARFKRIRIGDSIARGKAVVGEPLYKNIWDPEGKPPIETWVYSRKASFLLPFRYRGLVFSNGVVTEIHSTVTHAGSGM